MIRLVGSENDCLTCVLEGEMGLLFLRVRLSNGGTSKMPTKALALVGLAQQCVCMVDHVDAQTHLGGAHTLGYAQAARLALRMIPSGGRDAADCGLA